jgi:hypothetical protein
VASTSRYRIGGTRRVSLEQAINLKSAVDFPKSAGVPLNAHCIIHWVGTDAGDDADGELFAEVRETLSRWLRYRGVPFTAIWVREKKAGGRSEVEHAHLVFHLPDTWLQGSRLVALSGGVDGSDELLEVQAVLYRIVRRCAGRPDDYAVKLKIPTAGGNPGAYNGRSYDGLYLLKGGGKFTWKLFPRIRKEWRNAQGLILGKRCGCSQNLGPAARRRGGWDAEITLRQKASLLGLKLRVMLKKRKRWNTNDLAIEKQ